MPNKPVDSADIERFLHYIKQIESSGGKNTNHPVIKKGISKGERASGPYAFTDSTKEEMQSRNPALDESSSDDEYAKTMANVVLNRAGNDETLAAGLWNAGQNTPKENYPEVRDENINAVKYDALREKTPYYLDPNPYKGIPSDIEQNNQEKTDKFKLLKGLLPIK